MSQYANRILDALPQDVIAGIEPRHQPVKLSFTDMTAETDQLRAEVYFHFSGSGVALDWIGRNALGR
ncbi:hypothetical protein [Bradyrhizobium sp. USDA 4471]